jgi:F-type H+-transporting ATPase subunit epsilon
MIQVVIQTPEGALFKSKALSCNLPAKDGRLGIFKGHTSLLGILNPGIIELVKEHSVKKSYQIGEAFFFINNDLLTILADWFKEVDLQ